MDTDQYKVVRILGNGTFGAVHYVKDAAGKEFAMKVLKLDDSLRNVEAEIAIHKSLIHPHIVRYHDSFRTYDSLCIVMDLANSGSLFDLLSKQGRFSENKARWFFQQLIMAVDYCHKCGVVNRDIKLENLLLHVDPGFPHALLKMCDFGYSKAYRKSVCKTFAGTPTYMAPEILSSFWGQKTYNAELADIWSCGVVLYIMLYGVYPFDHWPEDKGVSESEKMKRMLERMTSRAYRIFPDVPVSNGCLDMLRGLLKPRPEERFQMEDILSHPWFQKNLPPLAMDMQRWYLQLSARGDASWNRQQHVGDESA